MDSVDSWNDWLSAFARELEVEPADVEGDIRLQAQDLWKAGASPREAADLIRLGVNL